MKLITIVFIPLLILMIGLIIYNSLPLKKKEEPANTVEPEIKPSVKEKSDPKPTVKRKPGRPKKKPVQNKTSPGGRKPGRKPAAKNINKK